MAAAVRAQVRWNEENLKHNDENRTATMKIDEPPTPFNFDYCDDEVEDRDDEELAARRDTQGGDQKAPTEQHASFADQWEAAGLSEAMGDVEQLQPTVLEQSEEAKEARRKAFEENRKKHYGMKEALAMRQATEEEDEDEDAEDD